MHPYENLLFTKTIRFLYPLLTLRGFIVKSNITVATTANLATRAKLKISLLPYNLLP